MEISSYIEQTLLEVFENYTLRGHILREEGLTAAHHMARCGAMAQAAGYDDEVVLAAFFHGIDRLLDPDELAETIGECDEAMEDHPGARYLRDRGFSERVAGLVEGYVSAQRYRAFQYPAFLDLPAPAGEPAMPMTPDEAAAFERRLDFLMCLKLCEWVDQAKEPDLQTVSPIRFKDIARRHLLLQFGDFTLARR